jgi:hypothetical protein
LHIADTTYETITRTYSHPPAQLKDRTAILARTATLSRELETRRQKPEEKYKPWLQSSSAPETAKNRRAKAGAIDAPREYGSTELKLCVGLKAAMGRVRGFQEQGDHQSKLTSDKDLLV